MLLVIKYVPSGLSCMSVMTALWLPSLAATSAPDLASNLATLPDSWPVRIKSDRGAKSATVALGPEGGRRISVVGSAGDEDGSSRAMEKVLA